MMKHLIKVHLLFILVLSVFTSTACSGSKSSLEKAVSTLESEIAADYEAHYKTDWPDRARNGYHCKFQIVDVRISSSNPDMAQVGVDRWGEDDFGQRLHMSQSLAVYDVEHIPCGVRPMANGSRLEAALTIHTVGLVFMIGRGGRGNDGARHSCL